MRSEGVREVSLNDRESSRLINNKYNTIGVGEKE